MSAIGEIYDDVSDLGLFLVSLSVLIMIIVAVVMILYSIILFVQSDPHSAIVEGLVTFSECNQLTTGLYRCDIEVTYQVNGVAHILKSEIDKQSVLKPGDSVTVRYDPDRPEDALVGMTPRKLASMALISGISILLVSFVSLWLVRRFKILAAAQGTSAIFALF